MTDCLDEGVVEESGLSGEGLLPNGGTSKSGSKDSVVAPAVGNFSVQYNFQTIAMALEIAKRSAAASPQRAWVDQQCKSVVFVGCILGQCCMGYLGDLIGRSRALSVTLALSAFGAFASAALPWGDAVTIYVVIIATRGLLGFGVGGVYPLSATSAAEGDGNVNTSNSGTTDKAEATARAADAFFWQTPGYMAPYVMALVLRAAMRSDDQSLQWRLLLGFGALPATAVLALRGFSETDTPLKESEQLLARTAATNQALAAFIKRPSTWRLLTGTGAGWMLYDIAFYGFTLMGPSVVATCFAGRESIMDEAWQQIIALSFAAPAVVATTRLIRRGWEPKVLQYAGFYLMAAAYVAFVVLRCARLGGWVLFVAYCFVNFCLNFGPNVTTFVLPSATYPPEMRSTLNGASSALGKVGAVIGTELLPAISSQLGLNALLLFCAALALAGAFLTHLCVDHVLTPSQASSPRLVSTCSTTVDDDHCCRRALHPEEETDIPAANLL